MQKYRFCKQGFDDALRFLQHRGLMTCTLCMTVESSYHLGIIADNKIVWVWLSTTISDTECSEHDECLQCLEQNERTKDCQVPDNVSQVFDKVHQREGTGEGGDKGSSFIEGLLQIKVFYLMCLPVVLWMKVIRFTLFLFSFLLLDNWMKQLVEPLTTFLLGSNLVSRGV